MSLNFDDGLLYAATELRRLGFVHKDGIAIDSPSLLKLGLLVAELQERRLKKQEDQAYSLRLSVLLKDATDRLSRVQARVEGLLDWYETCGIDRCLEEAGQAPDAIIAEHAGTLKAELAAEITGLKAAAGLDPITVLQLAEARASAAGLPLPRTGEDFNAVDLSIMGGCQRCAASIAAYNAYPSRTGFWQCGDCIGRDGFATAEEAEAWIAGQEAE